MSRAPHDPTPAASVEAQTRANILAQPLIPNAPDIAHVADLALPDELVRRIADRIIRSSFDEQFRTVFEDRPDLARPPVPPAPPGVPPLSEAWPELRGHRPALSSTDAPTPERFPGASDPAELHGAAQHVARRLARDGLPMTLAHACVTLAPLLKRISPADRSGLLARAGIPVDLAAMFHADGHPLAERLIELAVAGADAPALEAMARTARFDFHAALPGFVGVDDAGSQPSSRIRVQMSRPGHWNGEGGGPRSGDNLDVVLRLLGALPSVRIDAVIHAASADALRESLARAGIAVERVRIVPTGLPVSQWAQDNCKPGLIDSAIPAVLLPRFATRAEEGAKLDPGDTAALAHFPDVHAGHSPLHFQGGNAMLVRTARSERLLLVGEAEIARNVQLGLTPEQAAEALRIEMGADRVAVLPAVGFHIDTEFSVRVIGAETVAFVPDEEAAARIILQAMLRAAERSRLIPPAEMRALRTFADVRNDEQLLPRLWQSLAQISDSLGRIPLSAASLFSTAPSDPGPPNAQRFLSALDIIAAARPQSWEHLLQPHLLDNVRAIRRTAAGRADLHSLLRSLGFRVTPVPSLPGHRSASVINALHLPGQMLVPIRGGFLRPLDDAAIRTMRTHLDPAGIEIVPIPAGESERRGGAVHCSVAAFPDPNAPLTSAPAVPSKSSKS